LDGVRIIDKNDRVSKFENIGDNVWYFTSH
jgi:hypothetical protein